MGTQRRAERRFKIVDSTSHSEKKLEEKKYCSREIFKSDPKSSDFFRESILTEDQNYRKYMCKKKLRKIMDFGALSDPGF